MSKIPDVNLEFIKKNEVFILKPDYNDTIHDSLTEYFNNNDKEDYENMVQLVKDQANVFLKSANSRNEQDKNNVNKFSGVISAWNYDEHRIDNILTITLTYVDI